MKLSKDVLNERASERTSTSGTRNHACKPAGVAVWLLPAQSRSWVCRVLGRGRREVPELALSVKTNFFVQSLAARTPL